jgi:hypothetical protein
MLDGSIVYDEASAIGEVPSRVQNAINALRKSADDDKLASVSAMMETIPEKTKTPDKEDAKKKRKNAKKNKKERKSKKNKKAIK